MISLFYGMGRNAGFLSLSFFEIVEKKIERGEENNMYDAFMRQQNFTIERKIILIFHTAHCFVVLCSNFFIEKKIDKIIKRIFPSYGMGRNVEFFSLFETDFLCIEFLMKWVEIGDSSLTLKQIFVGQKILSFPGQFHGLSSLSGSLVGLGICSLFIQRLKIFKYIFRSCRRIIRVVL